jgi:amidohydrolase
MAIALITAKILCQHQKKVNGHVKFVFQPGEEGFGGAQEMINAGVLTEPKVDAAIGLHLTHFLQKGTVAVKSGPIMASMDSVDIRVLGKAGHAAMPHEGVDAILIGAHVINTLQSLISKEISPMTPLVVHIGTVHGGDAFNIIADNVELKGTVRCLDEQLQKSMPVRMERILKGIVTGLRGKYDLKYQFGYPPLINNEGMVALIRDVAKKVIGKDHVVQPQPIMASDDMAFFLRQVPGCYFFLGAGNPEKGFDQPAHSPHFDFDEDAMIIGAEIMINAALRYFKSN